MKLTFTRRQVRDRCLDVVIGCEHGCLEDALLHRHYLVFRPMEVFFKPAEVFAYELVEELVRLELRCLAKLLDLLLLSTSFQHLLRELA